jgi:RHS repeat-associated protein
MAVGSGRGVRALRRSIALLLCVLFVGYPIEAFAQATINLQFGYYQYNNVDLVIGGQYPIRIVRHYQSKKSDGTAVGPGPFGPGTHMGLFSLEAKDYDNGMIGLRLPTGDQTVFVCNGNTCLNNSARDELRGTLTRDSGSNAFFLKVEDGTEMKFDITKDGDPIRRLVSIKDRYNQTASLSYNQEKLIQILNPIGRGVNLEYADGVQVSRIVSFSLDGSYPLVQARYEYDPSGTRDLRIFRNNLDGKTVQTVDSNGTYTNRVASGAYTYTFDSSGNHQLIKVTNPRGIDIFENEYTDSKVTRQILPGTNGVWDNNGSIRSYYDYQSNYTLVRDYRNDSAYQTQYNYDPSNMNVGSVAVKNPSGGTDTTSFGYDPNTNLQNYVQNARGKRTNYTYSNRVDNSTTYYHLQDVIEPEQTIKTTFNFTAQFGQISSFIDARNNQDNWIYNANGTLFQFDTLITSVPSNLYYTERFTQYNQYGQVTESYDGAGRKYTYTYDPNTRDLKTVTRPDGITVNFTYDSQSRLAYYQLSYGGTIDVNSSIIFGYDPLNRVIRKYRYGRPWTKFTYDDVSNVLSVHAPNSVLTRYEYDAQDRVKKRIQGSQVYQYLYNRNNQLERVTDAKGQNTTYAYDQKFRTQRVTYHDGTYIEYAYDNLDRVTLVTDSSDSSKAKDVAFTYYDDNNQIPGPRSVTTAPGSANADTLLYEYDAVGNLTAVSRPLPIVTSFSPTAGLPPVTITINGNYFSRATAVKIGNNNVSSFTVNSDTRITAQLNSPVPSGPISVTTPIGTGTSTGTFTVTSIPLPTINSVSDNNLIPGDAISINGANFTSSATISFRRNSNSYSASSTFVNSTQLNTVTPNVPSSGNYNIRVCNDASSCTTSSFTVYIYIEPPCLPPCLPGIRQRTKTTDKAATASTTSTTRSKSKSAGKQFGQIVTASSHTLAPVTTDSAGSPGISNKALLRYTYYNDDSLKTATLVGDSGQSNLQVFVAYNSNSEPITLNYGYNDLTNTANIRVWGNIYYNPQGDVADLLFGTTSGSSDLRQVTYAWDYLNRGFLTSRIENGPSGTVPAIATSQTYTYNREEELLTATTPTCAYARTFDTDGNPTSIDNSCGSGPVTYQPGTNRFASFAGRRVDFDANGNQTRQVCDGTLGPCASIDETYVWNARDQLVTHTNTAGLNATFVYDALGRRIRKTFNGVTTTFVYSGDQIIEETTNGITKRYLVGLGLDDVWASREGTTDEFLLKDALNGSVLAALNPGSPTATVKTGYGYAPFGNTFQTNTNSNNNLTFAGRENEPGGMYFRARYYNPDFGRFISEDPIGFQGGDTNLYRYVSNNPHLSNDPTGLEGGDGFSGFVEGVVRFVISFLGGLFGLISSGSMNPAQPPMSTAFTPGVPLNIVNDNYGITISERCSQGGTTFISDAKCQTFYRIEEGGVDLYRAVGEREFKDVITTKIFRQAPNGASLEVKQFGLDFNETLKLADFLRNTVAIIRVRIPRSIFNTLDKTPVDPSILKSGSVTVQPNKLDVFNRSIIEIEQAF